MLEMYQQYQLALLLRMGIQTRIVDLWPMHPKGSGGVVIQTICQICDKPVMDWQPAPVCGKCYNLTSFYFRCTDCGYVLDDDEQEMGGGVCIKCHPNLCKTPIPF